MEKPARFKVDDKQQRDIYQHIFENAMGNPLVMDAEPAGDDIKMGTPVRYGDDLFIKFPDGKTYKFTGTAI